ncbi:MAG: conjugal transfer protein TraX [Lachnospiraceae bacterium]|nr:conjugal transfer protein TraX [Lachnospiraceae bacterium]
METKGTPANIRLSCTALKIIACVFMLIDHIAYGIIHNYMAAHGMDILPESYTTLNKVYTACRGVGRLAFPIFTFFLVEGFFRTKNKWKYAARLAVFAVISEIPFDLGLYGKLVNNEHQNIMLTFLIALLMLILLRFLDVNTFGLSRAVVYLAQICAVIAFADAAYLLHSDYSWKCMLLAAVLYFTKDLGELRLLAGAASTSWEKYAPISFILLYFYDPSIKPRFKYAFYIFYPLHLFVIYLLAKLII